MRNLIRKIIPMFMLAWSIASYGQTDSLVQKNDSINYCTNCGSLLKKNEL